MARGEQYGKFTNRHHVVRKSVSPNQTKSGFTALLKLHLWKKTKSGHVWFGDTYFLNPWCLTVNLPYCSLLATSLKLFCSFRPMCPNPKSLFLTSYQLDHRKLIQAFFKILIGKKFDFLNKNLLHIIDSLISCDTLSL